MATTEIEALGGYLENWVHGAPHPSDMDSVGHDAMLALVEAGMVQYNPEGWDFKLHEKHPDAPKAQFKLMIRQAPGVDTNPAYYDRFTLPSVLQAGESGALHDVDSVLGYPNAGTPIAKAFVRLSSEHLGIQLEQLQQEKITHQDGRRELGAITSQTQDGEMTVAIDDTATGGDTKIEGWKQIVKHGLGYAGLILLVERDPLGTELVRQKTGAEVATSMHWLTIIQCAAKALNLPRGAAQQEFDYTRRLFAWNVANDNLGSLPDPKLILPR